jgi:isopenicillin-N N-acyltransferase-like protein
LPVVELGGSAHERGLSHGEQLRNEIAESYDAWIDAVSSEKGVREADLISYAAAYLPASRTYAPELVDEVEGIARGAALSFESVFLLNCFDEVACHGAGMLGAGLRGCTAFAVVGRAVANGQTYVGQGWDMPRHFPPYVMRLIDEAGPNVLTLTHPGHVGGSGINECGLAIVWNTLKASDIRVGVPSTFVIRKALQAKELAELIGNAIGSPRANGMNFMAADADAAVDIELSASRYSVTYCDGVLSHANHFEAAHLLAYESDLPIDAADTLLRSGRMRLLLEESRGSIDLERLRTIMADHAGRPGSICRHDARGFTTLSSVIYSPLERKMWATNGNPCTEPFLEYTV